MGAVAAGAAVMGLAGCSAPAAEGEGESSNGAALKEATQTLECDVAVVGLGASGLFAAYNAAVNGAKVIGVDLATSMQGTTNTGTSASWVCGTDAQEQSPAPLTVREMMDYLNNGTNYQSNQKALRSVLGNGGKAMQVLIDAGMPIASDFSAMDANTPIPNRGAVFYGVSGKERAEYFTKVLDEAGVEYYFGVRAENLLFNEANEVCGVQCVTDEDVIDISAKAVVLATGGFLGSPEEVAKYFAGAEILCMGNKNNTGTGINMAISAGGQIGKCFSTGLNEYGGANKKASPSFAFRPGYGTNETMRLPVFGGLLTDATGSRFINEQMMCEKTMFCSEPGLRETYFYAVCDEAYVKMWETTPLHELLGDPRMKMMFNGIVVSDLREQIEAAIEEGWAFKADTIAELADHFGLVNLEATVAEYNEMCAAGSDELFFKPEQYLIGIEEGPFYIVESMSAGWGTLGGIKCDGNMQVVRANNQVVPHLFIAGTDADLFTSPYYVGGTNNGFSLGSGMVAGAAAAKDALSY